MLVRERAVMLIRERAVMLIRERAVNYVDPGESLSVFRSLSHRNDLTAVG